jgi:hypothetical protein
LNFDQECILSIFPETLIFTDWKHFALRFKVSEGIIPLYLYNLYASEPTEQGQSSFAETIYLKNDSNSVCLCKFPSFMSFIGIQFTKIIYLKLDVRS